MKATSPLLTSEDEFPAVSRRNGGEAGEEEAAAKPMVATPGSDEDPTAGEGRPELHDSGGTGRRQHSGQGERRRRAAVCGERGGGQGSLLYAGVEEGDGRERRGKTRELAGRSSMTATNFTLG
ncbi:hypothetical protein OsJ_24162 [Oryza sativa Japonica Group]|uniref:Uncharacterized protein n=1 Tax=Oryza sativa subsp. japonica TaxID=39947 RepID=A3BJI4_ORYSJ|nr:hypothetical protein OsJ_24162 [Oryza sativa Japonica Group]